MTTKKDDRYDFSKPKKLVNIFLSRVQPSKEYPDIPCFEILSVKDNKTVHLLAANEKEKEEWINSIQLKTQKLIEVGQEDEGSKTEDNPKAKSE